MKNTSAIGLIFMLAWLAGCSTPRIAAPVVERNAQGQMVEVPRTAPSEATASGKPAEGRGYYTVKKGDTLSRIALDNGQNYRDLVAWNNLANANDIKVDQTLRVLPPDDAGANPPNAQATGQTTGIAMPPAGDRTALPPPGAQSSAVAAASVATANKTSPRGEKRPYSEAALAELQKPDAAAATVTAAGSVAGPADAVVVEPATEEAVSWMWPADGKPAGPYDDAKKGIDIPGKLGQQVLAAAAGKVLYAGTMRGYGNLVIVKHSSTLLSAYAHNKAILVKEGQTVAKGQQIAEMGDSDTDSVRLHFEVRQQGKPVDPTKFLPTVR